MTLEGGVTPESLARVRDRLVAVRRGVRDGLQSSFRRAGTNWERKVGARFTGTTGPTSLRTRSGRLARAVRHDVTGSTLADLKLSMHVTGVPYARIQEFGGEIKPTRGKYLAWPILGNLNPSGTAKVRSASALISANPKKTFFRPSKKNPETLILFLNKAAPRFRKAAGLGNSKADRAKAVPMFALRTSVDLPGPNSPSKRGPSRLGVYDTWRDEIPNLRNDLRRVAESITTGVSGAPGGA